MQEAESETKRLTRTIQRSNSLSWNFYKGVFYGFGFFIGSAIVVALIIFILDFLATIPFFSQIIEQIRLMFRN